MALEAGVDVEEVGGGDALPWELDRPGTRRGRRLISRAGVVTRGVRWAQPGERKFSHGVYAANEVRLPVTARGFCGCC